jgi:hypothetical protein
MLRVRVGWRDGPAAGQQLPAIVEQHDTVTEQAPALLVMGSHDAGGATCESERWRLESVVDRVPSWKWMERISRKACVEVGSIASTCKAPRTGKEVKECAILGSTTKAIAIGRTVMAATSATRPRRRRDPVRMIRTHVSDTSAARLRVLISCRPCQPTRSIRTR